MFYSYSEIILSWHWHYWRQTKWLGMHDRLSLSICEWSYAYEMTLQWWWFECPSSLAVGIAPGPLPPLVSICVQVIITPTSPDDKKRVTKRLIPDLVDFIFKGLITLSPPNYSIWIFTHLKLCLADAIHNFKWVKIIQNWQNGGQLFSNLADWCHMLSLTCLKGGT